MDTGSPDVHDDSQKEPFPQVTVYTSSDCVWCPHLKAYLSQKGVPYIEKNVELDEAAAAEALGFAGRRQTPVTVIGSRVVVGFQRGELDAILGIDQK